jgi:signal peptidase I
LGELPVLLVIAALIAFFIKTFIAQAFYIPSGSMEPQLLINDRVVVSKLAYHLHDPRRGDIVVFDCPPRATCPQRTHGGSPIGRAIRYVGEKVGVVQPSTDEFIKRIIGLPGETVEGRGGHVYVNGHLLVEPYLHAGVVTSDFPARVVEPGHHWVMGDNRGNSSDSRFFGTIRRSTVVGRTIVKVWPVAHACFL